MKAGRMRAVSPDPADVIVLGIDPGLTTGVAAYRPAGLFALGTEEPFSSTQIEGRHAFYDFFDALVASGAPFVVVMEAFIVSASTARKSPQLDPLYIIGAVERQCHKLGIPFLCQTPSAAKAFATDEKLKAVGFYRAGQGHANDAARHALTYMVSQRQEAGGRALLGRLAQHG